MPRLSRSISDLFFEMVLLRSAFSKMSWPAYDIERMGLGVNVAHHGKFVNHTI